MPPYCSHLNKLRTGLLKKPKSGAKPIPGYITICSVDLPGFLLLQLIAAKTGETINDGTLLATLPVSYHYCL